MGFCPQTVPELPDRPLRTHQSEDSEVVTMLEPRAVPTSAIVYNTFCP